LPLFFSDKKSGGLRFTETKFSGIGFNNQILGVKSLQWQKPT